MAGTSKVFGPAFLSNAVADIYTPPAATIYQQIRQIHLVNVTTGPLQVTLYKGATGASAAGTEIAKLLTVPADDFRDLHFPAGLVMKSTDFLTGICIGTATGVTITVIADQTVVP